MTQIMYAFDLDGTVTKEETLPLIAKELGLETEMKLLTQLTLDGLIEFSQSFRLRFHVLNGVPIKTIQDILENTLLDEDIARFIINNSERCAIVTGNLDLWIAPLVAKLGCKCYSSKGEMHPDGRIELQYVLHKSEAIRKIRETAERIIAVGDSFNDVPMFEEADVAIAYGGVHDPVTKAIQNADYVTYDGGSLCKLLKML